MSKSSSNIDVKYIKLNIATNIGETLKMEEESQKKTDTQKSAYQPLTSDMIHIPGEDLSYLKQQKSKYPCITDKILYPYPVLQSKTMKELVDIFFNPLNFEKFLLENKEETIDANEKKGGSGTQTSGDDNDETMSANNDGEIIGHESDPKDPNLMKNIQEVLRQIDKYLNHKSAKGIFKKKVPLTNFMENVDKIDSNYNNESHINGKFLNIDVEDDSIKTYYIQHIFGKHYAFHSAIEKILEGTYDASNAFYDSTFEAMSESLAEKKEKIEEILNGFNTDASNVLQCKPVTSEQPKLNANLLTNVFNFFGQPATSQTEQEDTYDASHNLFVDLTHASELCKSMNDIRAFIKEKEDVDTDINLRLNKVNLLLRVLENITEIFRLMKEVSETYENIRTPSTDNIDPLFNEKYNEIAELDNETLKSQYENDDEYKYNNATIVIDTLKQNENNLFYKDAIYSYLSSDPSFNIQSFNDPSFNIYDDFIDSIDNEKLQNFVEEKTKGRIINDTNAPEIIPKVKDIFTTLIEINNLYEFIDQLNDDSPAMDPTGDEGDDDDYIDTSDDTNDFQKKAEIVPRSAAFEYDDGILETNLEKNLMLMLNLLFPTLFYHSNYINHSMNLIKNQNEFDDELGNKQYSYIKINGTIHTVMKVVWLNDILNNPFYNQLMTGVHEYVTWGLKRRQLIDSEINKEANNLKQIIDDYVASVLKDDSKSFEKDKESIDKRLNEYKKSKDSRNDDYIRYMEDFLGLLNEINNFDRPKYVFIEYDTSNSNNTYNIDSFYAAYTQIGEKLKSTFGKNEGGHDVQTQQQQEIIDFDEIDFENSILYKIGYSDILDFRSVNNPNSAFMNGLTSLEGKTVTMSNTGKINVDNIEYTIPQFQKTFIITKLEKLSDETRREIDFTDADFNDLVIYKIDTLMQKIKDRKFQTIGTLLSMEFNNMVKKFQVIDELKFKSDFKNKYLSCEMEHCIAINIDDKEVKEDKYLETVELLKNYVQTSKISGSISTHQDLQNKINNFAFVNNKNRVQSDKSLYHLSNAVIAKMDNKETDNFNVDDINVKVNELITKKATDPHYEAFIQMDVLGGEINKDNLNVVKCDYKDEKLSKDFMDVFIVPVSDLKYWKISKMPYVDFTAKLKKSEEKKKSDDEKKIQKSKTKKNPSKPTTTRKEKKGGMRTNKKTRKNKKKHVRFAV